MREWKCSTPYLLTCHSDDARSAKEESALRLCDSKQQVPRRFAPRNDKDHTTSQIPDNFGGLVTDRPPLKGSRASLGGQPGAAVPTTSLGADEGIRPAQTYCATTITGALLAMTGPGVSAPLPSMRITCPGSGGTRPMRRASRSILSGSRSDASSSRRA